MTTSEAPAVRDRRTPLVRAAVGFVVGLVAAGIGLWLAPDAAAETTVIPGAVTTTTESVATTEAPWVPGGVRFSSTVVIPTNMEVADGIVTLDYTLTGLGTAGNGVPSIVPERWELVTADGTLHEGETGPAATDQDGGPVTGSVRFEDLPVSTGEEDVRRVAVVGWRAAAPLETVFEIPTDEGSTVEVHDGTVVVLSSILEQSTGTILDFDTTSPPDRWREDEGFLFCRSTVFRGDGPGWLSSASTIGGIGGVGGATGFQLRWSELEVPEVVGVRYSTTVWTPLPGELVLIEDGDFVG